MKKKKSIGKQKNEEIGKKDFFHLLKKAVTRKSSSLKKSALKG